MSEAYCFLCSQRLDGVDEVELPCGCHVHTECADKVQRIDPVGIAECAEIQMDTAESVQADG